MKVTLIHNSKAGDDDQPSGDVLSALICQAGYDVIYQSTKDKNWQAVLEDPGAFVVAAGGDGTVGKVAKQLVGLGIPLAILPLGTAKNIAKTLHCQNLWPHGVFPGAVDRWLGQCSAG